MIALPIIEVVFQSAVTVYAVIRDRITGKVWNNNTPGFEVYNEAHWTSYAIPLTEQTGSGYYWAASPSGISGFLTSCTFFQQAGGSPSSADAPGFSLGYPAGQNVNGISGDPLTAPTNLQAVLSSEAQGAVESGEITSQGFPTNLTNANAGAYQGRVLYFLSGVCAGMAGLIANYAPVDGVITLSGSLAATPSAADAFIIA